jgi:malate synthase
MSKRTQAHHLEVSSDLFNFVQDEVLPGTELSSDAFWKSFSDLVMELAPINASLLAERERLQHELDAWHQKHPGTDQKQEGLQRLFTKNWLFGALNPRPVKITTANVDQELSSQARPTAGRAHLERPLCTECSQRQMELFV